jgi:hypothetical protein
MYGNSARITQHPLRTIEENREYLEADSGVMRPTRFVNREYPRRYLSEVPPHISRSPHISLGSHMSRVHHISRSPHIIYRGSADNASADTSQYLPPTTAQRRVFTLCGDYNPILLSLAAIGAIVGVIIAIVKYTA